MGLELSLQIAKHLVTLTAQHKILTGEILTNYLTEEKIDEWPTTEVL